MKMSDNFEKFLASKCANHEMHEGRNLFPGICDRIEKIRNRKKNRNLISGIAASIVLLTGLYFGFNYTNSDGPNTLAVEHIQQSKPLVVPKENAVDYIQESISNEQIDVVSDAKELTTIVAQTRGEVLVLPDQSKITLEKGASISYNQQYGVENRKITFSGIAYFEVKPDKKRPFLIETSNSITKVVGTAFNLVSQNGTSDQIAVTSGIVEFGSIKSKSTKRLVKGQKAIVVKDKVEVSEYFDSNLLSWKTGTLIFDETTLKDMIPVVNQYFGKELKLQNTALENCTFSGQFEAPALKDFLDVLSLSLNIEYKIQGKQVILSGVGCN